MICCPFCQSTNLIKENPASPNEMSVYVEHDGGNDLSFFDGNVYLVHCGNVEHGFYLTPEQSTDITFSNE